MRQFLLTLWNTYSFWVLYANAEGLEPDELASRAAPAPRRLDASSTAGRSRACRRTVADRPRAHRRLRLHHRRAGRSPPTSTSSPTGTCGSRGGASGRATAPPSRPCATACVEVAKLLAPFTPFLADEIYANLVGGRGGRVRRRARLGPPRRLPRGRRGARRRRARGRDGGGPPHRRARPRGARPGEGEGPPAAAQGGDRRHRRRARRDRAPRRPRRLRAEREGARVRRRGGASWSATAVKPNYRALGPRFGKQMPQVAAAVEALDAEHVAAALEAGGEVGISIDGHDHALERRRHRPGDGAARGLPGRGRGRPRGRARARARRRAARARASPARSSTRSRTRARSAGLESPTGSSSRSAATTSCSRRPAPTRPTSRARPWRSRSATTAAEKARPPASGGRELRISVSRA